MSCGAAVNWQAFMSGLRFRLGFIADLVDVAFCKYMAGVSSIPPHQQSLKRFRSSFLRMVLWARRWMKPLPQPTRHGESSKTKTTDCCIIHSACREGLLLLLPPLLLRSSLQDLQSGHRGRWLPSATHDAGIHDGHGEHHRRDKAVYKMACPD